MSDCETHYNQVQKLLYAVLIIKCKIMHYFKSHPMCLVTSFGLGDIVGNCLTTGRITKWALELMGLDMAYVPPNDNQVPGPDGLCGLMDQDSTAPRSLKSIGACILMSPLPSTVPGEVLC
jgi:hypothetical protein